MALVFERFLTLKTSRVAPPKLTDEAILVSRAGLPSVDLVRQLEQNSVLGEVLASGFRALNANPRISEIDLHATLENSGRQAAHIWSVIWRHSPPLPQLRPCWACWAR